MYTPSDFNRTSNWFFFQFVMGEDARLFGALAFSFPGVPHEHIECQKTPDIGIKHSPPVLLI